MSIASRVALGCLATRPARRLQAGGPFSERLGTARFICVNDDGRCVGSSSAGQRPLSREPSPAHALPVGPRRMIERLSVGYVLYPVRAEVDREGVRCRMLDGHTRRRTSLCWPRGWRRPDRRRDRDLSAFELGVRSDRGRDRSGSARPIRRPRLGVIGDAVSKIRAPAQWNRPGLPRRLYSDSRGSSSRASSFASRKNTSLRASRRSQLRLRRQLRRTFSQPAITPCDSRALWTPRLRDRPPGRE